MRTTYQLPLPFDIRERIMTHAEHLENIELQNLCQQVRHEHNQVLTHVIHAFNNTEWLPDVPLIDRIQICEACLQDEKNLPFNI